MDGFAGCVVEEAVVGEMRDGGRASKSWCYDIVNGDGKAAKFQLAAEPIQARGSVLNPRGRELPSLPFASAGKPGRAGVVANQEAKRVNSITGS